jgi:hypothetical protein
MYNSKDPAIVQALISWLTTAAARVRAQVNSCGPDKMALGQVFSEYFVFPPTILIPPSPPQSSSTITQGWSNRPISGGRTKWSVSPHRKKLKKKKCNSKADCKWGTANSEWAYDASIAHVWCLQG